MYPSQTGSAPISRCFTIGNVDMCARLYYEDYDRYRAAVEEVFTALKAIKSSMWAVESLRRSLAGCHNATFEVYK